MKQNGKQGGANKEDQVHAAMSHLSPVVHWEESPPLGETEQAVGGNGDAQHGQQG